MNIGIDIGGVILEHYLKGRPIKEIDGAIENISKLAKEHEIYIISKIEKSKEKVIKDLENISFFEKTGVKKENIFFVLKKEDKTQVALNLKIDLFIDNDFGVLKYMTQKGIYTICLNKKYKKPQTKQANDLVRSWNEIINIIENLRRHK